MTREELLNRAVSYIKDTPYSNPNEITKWFWNNELSHAWCGAFIKYLVKHDLNCDWLDECYNFGYVPTIVEWAKNKGYWNTDYTKAQKGDLVVYNWTPNTTGYSHIGIVESVSSNSIVSVDGNTTNDKYSDNCVARRTRNKKYIAGVVLLPYENKGDNMKFKIGDKVIINGNLYASSFAEKASGSVSNKETYITRVALNAKHPYNTTNDLGWMNESDIKLYEEQATDYKSLYEKQLLVNKDLTSQIENLQSKINKALTDLK